MQETHSTNIDAHIWKNQWGGSHANFAHGESNSKGVAILIQRNNNFTIEQTVADTDGRYLMLKGIFEGIKILLLNIYAPNSETERNKFFLQIKELIEQQ